MSCTQQLLTCCLTCTGQSVEHHFLASYYHAILSVVLAQFSHKGFTDGMTGIVHLAQASPFLQAGLHLCNLHQLS